MGMTAKRRLLVTGGAGFIGINTARHFLKQGWSVTILDNFSRAGTDINLRNLEKDDLKNWRVVKVDITSDLEVLEREVGASDAVIHLAAQVAVTTSITDPRNDFEQNALGTLNVLEAIRLSKNRPPLIFASTNKVYGSLPHVRVRTAGKRFVFTDAKIQKNGVSENMPLDFHSPYGCSKGAADQYVLDYSRIYGLKAVVFRQSCVYGEHQFGVEDQGWVAWFTIAAMKGRRITLYGSGKQVRDVLYVGDLVQLYEKAFLRINRVSGRAYNIGGGPKNTVSLLECLEHLQKLLGRKIDRSIAPIRAGDQPIFVADVRKAKKDFGWVPATSFEKGCARMHAWMEANREAVTSLAA